MDKKLVNIGSKYLRYKNILAIPSIHSRVYFSLCVREAFETFKPTAILIEQPLNFTLKLRESVSRLPFISMISREVNDEAVFIPIDPCDSIIEGVRLAIDNEIPFFGIDKDLAAFPSNSHYLMPDDYLLTKIGLEKFYIEVLNRYSLIHDDVDQEREYHMAYKIHQLSKEYENVLVIVGLSHWANILEILKKDKFDEPIEEFDEYGEYNVYNIHKDSNNKILGEMPFITYMYELFRNNELDSFDKQFCVETIFREAYKKYKLPVSPSQLSKMMVYLRNLCILENYIMPDAIDMLTAAKCMVNNDYALEVMDGIHYYPYYTDEDDRYETIKLNKNPNTDKLEGLLKTKKINLNRYDNVWKTSLKKIKVTTRPKEKYDGEWEDAWNNRSDLLSHVPEDTLMENHMNLLREKIKNMLTKDKMRIEPFTTSLKDGIDMRETIKNYYKKEVYVKEYPKLKGEIGHMVVIFDDEHDTDYDWNIVWYSEAHDDSDLILYATEPGINLVGPGISKCYFGGYTSLMPPQGPHDVWGEYEALKSSGYVQSYSDLLLYTAIIYSEDKYIGFIAPKKPSDILHNLAKQKGVEIIFVPLTTFSSETLRKLRHFHVLGNKRLRSIAKDYII